MKKIASKSLHANSALAVQLNALNQSPVREAGLAFIGIWLLASLSCQAFADTANNPTDIRYGSGTEILLQGFHWNSTRSPTAWYETLASQAPTIAADGFTAIWMPPSWRDDSSWTDSKTGASGGGEGYFWHDFNKNGHYGSDAQLKQAVKALTSQQIKLVYDVVPNHMDRTHTNTDLPAGENLWRSDCATCDDGDPFMSGDSDLNDGNPKIQTMFADEFINLQKNYGAAGLRFDFVRGYAPEHVSTWMSQALGSGFCVGEMWKGPSEFPAGDPRSRASWQEVLKDWSDRAQCTVFDFALKERMQNGAIADWRSGLNGNPDPRWRAVAVTFLDNHDTGYSPGPNGGQHHWPLEVGKVKAGYAYILSSPGTPTVYWPQMYDGSLHDYLRLLIQNRKAVGVRADSDIQFPAGYSGLVALIKGTQQQLLVALSSNLTTPEQVAGNVTTPVLVSGNGDIRIWRSGPPAALVAVPFQCDNGTTTPGNSVYVSGSSPELGRWDLSKAVRLSDVSAYPTWRGSLSLPAQQGVEWKCLVRNENDSNQGIRWQGGANNELFVSPGVSANSSF
jgi:hypothetical protein